MPLPLDSFLGFAVAHALASRLISWVCGRRAGPAMHTSIHQNWGLHGGLWVLLAIQQTQDVRQANPDPDGTCAVIVFGRNFRRLAGRNFRRLEGLSTN
jgi:hypothetical protein